MGKDPFDWISFRDIATPEDTARTLTDWYGPQAAQFAAECAPVARSNDRNEDYRFWYAVFVRLRAGADETNRPMPRDRAGA